MKEPTFTANEMLTFLSESDIINMGDVQELMAKKRYDDYLKKVHSYTIWQASDGRWKSYIPDASASKGRKLIAKSSETALKEYLCSFYKGTEQPSSQDGPTLRKLYPEWLEYKKLHTNAESYILRIQTDWKTYYDNTPIIDIPIRQLDKLTLDKWVHSLIQTHHMTKTKYYNVTVIMRQALLYAVDLGIIESSPLAKVKVDGKRMFQKVKKKPDHTQVFLDKEVKAMTEMAWEDFHNKASRYELAPLALLFQLQTGLRIGEVCAVSFDDIETPGYIHIQRMVRRDTNEVVEHTKTECGDRYVILTAKASKIIEAAKERQREYGIKNGRYIFSLTPQPVPEHAVAYLYEKYCRKMGIIQKSSHKARKTYISCLIDGRVNINTVREMVGHADEKTTLRNYVFDRSTDAEKLHKIEAALS